MSDNATTARLADRIRRYRHLLPPVSAASVARMNVDGESASGWTPEVAEPPGTPVWAELDGAALRDRALGCLLGLAVGDAIGATVAGQTRGSFAPLVEPDSAAAWTGDTGMALCLGQSLLASDGVDLDDFMARLLASLEHGDNTVDGQPADVGTVTRQAIERYVQGGTAAAGDLDAASAGNGSLVRLAPLAIFCARDRDAVEALAIRQSRATHATLECIDACRLFAVQLVDALAGANKASVLRQRVMALCPQVLFISAGEFKTKTLEQIGSSAYVIDTLDAALWAVWRTDSFRDAVLTAANLGGAAHSVAAVAGQLAGALYGASAIPAEWLEPLAGRERIEFLANDLFERAPAAA